jgi:hypothetical protein
MLCILKHGLLLNVHSARRSKPSPAWLDRLRTLRDRGLLAYDGSTLASSSEVWLTPLGTNLAETLLGRQLQRVDPQPTA